MTVRILHGDCREVMATLPEASVDAIVCDPPYELGFMGKGWDSTGIANDPATWRQALRVLKPGGHLLAFSGTRTYHRMVCAIEDAGFEIRDQIGWLYGSGFPKSLDVSKAIDKSRAGSQFDAIRQYLRECIASAGTTHKAIKLHLGYPEDSGTVSHWVANSQPSVPGWADWQAMKAILPIDARFDDLIQTAEREKIGEKRSGIADGEGPRHTIGGASSVVVDVTAPATDAARQWQGWGTALKPAWEPIVVARKPLIGTVAANVLQHGTGAINIDGCRVGETVETWPASRSYAPGQIQPGGKGETQSTGAAPPGRWPANIIHDGSDEVLAAFPETTSVGHAPGARGRGGVSTSGHAGQAGLAEARFDTGSAARFFYTAKASAFDRNDGAGKNTHPTVKPTDLMRYLVRLVTPPGGTVLDPFMGSGSTLKAAELEGFAAIGIELDAAYIEIAKRRIGSDAPLFAEVA